MRIGPQVEKRVVFRKKDSLLYFPRIGLVSINNNWPEMNGTVLNKRKNAANITISPAHNFFMSQIKTDTVLASFSHEKRAEGMHRDVLLKINMS